MPPSWPQLRYSLYAPIYDLFAGRFARQRQRSLRLAGPGAQDRVLLVGAGTGLDLPELRACGEVLATDISPAMLARLSRRAARLGMTVKAQVMDAEALDAPDDHYTLVVLHLILAVVTMSSVCSRSPYSVDNAAFAIVRRSRRHSRSSRSSALVAHIWL